MPETRDEFPFAVFLSHGAKDKPLVRPLAERLRQDGLKVWYDEWVLLPGDNIPAKIEEGLEQSRVLVLCMSANAFGSDWVQLGAGAFRFRDPLNQERRFISLRLDDAPIKGCLAQFLYINWNPEVCLHSSRSNQTAFMRENKQKLRADDSPNYLAQTLRHWGAKNGWPLKKAAGELGVREATWSRWESGGRFPLYALIQPLADFVRTPVCRFLCPNESLCPLFLARPPPGAYL